MVVHLTTGFNIIDEKYINESFLFVFLEDSNNTIVTNYRIAYAKQYICLDN